ncbi:5-formyltetrahydrofolate cyclo-ligase [Halioxenophilus sp. WMMB6]|uniref:5-formyltetrahydrofolate cyclo-ligase n=1 Tax=Halioxenophilus sp. WMMB6 TaxID=3073815 RepID=UPI00295EA8E0|nr:5-formyltetrahydrofolate cyclo-ligase [Halioxenophilus sp. WMMB6]
MSADPANLSTLKRQIRQTKRRARRQISRVERQAAARQLSRAIYSSQLFLRARHIALYWPMGEEIDPRPLLHFGPLARHKHWYLPVVNQRGYMQFHRYHADAPLAVNRYGIAQPLAHPGRVVDLWRLDLVLMPLVSFDHLGNRLGMGGGYYDRWLATQKRRLRRPRLVGIGFYCQKYEQALPTEPWDQPLDGIVTEKGWFIKTG